MAGPGAARPAPVRSSPFVRLDDGGFPLEAVGESHYQDALLQICGRYNRYGHQHECEASIGLEPDNPYDANAVRVSIQGRTVGYLPRHQASRVAAAMRELGISAAGCGARVNGGWRTNQHDQGYFGVRLAVPTWGPIDFGSAGTSTVEQSSFEDRPRVERPKASPTGPLSGHRVVILGSRGDCELASQLAKAGARIMAGLGKTTTLLVVAGRSRPFDEGTRQTAYYYMAEEMIAQGANIQILSEEEAISLIAA